LPYDDRDRHRPAHPLKGHNVADEKRSKRSRKTVRADQPSPTDAPVLQIAAGQSVADPPRPDGGASEGSLAFDPAIITEIAMREASEIEGIAELTGGWRTKGVQVGESSDGGDEGYVLDLRIAVEYGVNCLALSETIRSRIAGAILLMTGRKTRAINIHVTAIRERGLREEHHDEGPSLGEEHGIDF
jgi:uncharacterized alkaline shock family protein YloU